MRWVLIVLALVTASLVGVVVAGSSPNLNQCTQVGTKQEDVMAGTIQKDVLCALQANDYQSGSKQSDTLFGDSGRDTIVGGLGADILKGGRGADRLFSVDGKSNDVLNGQKGKDSCFGDPGDKMKGCEHKFRGASVHMANELSTAFHGGLSLAEALIEAGVSPPPPPVIVTITETLTLPPCNQGPPDPPPFCGG
jgi:Ca2+-binding RTX toxin-like protein